MANAPKLSIVMPCYNVADTIDRALASIWMQRVNFLYEVILVNDGSEDDTAQRVQAHVAQGHPLQVITHTQNKGNAVSFYDGLSLAAGDYFCVLDGDDFYTHCDKLQKQVDFLDSDVRGEYVGAAHYFVMDLCNGDIYVPSFPLADIFDYADFLTGHSFYYHTATYMYRHIFRGRVPLWYAEHAFHGDTPYTLFHLRQSGQKIKVLPFFGSCYTFSGGGIWTGLGNERKREHQLAYLERLLQVLDTEIEQKQVRRQIEKLNEQEEVFFVTPSGVSMEMALKGLSRYMRQLQKKGGDCFEKRIYFSQYIESFCVCVGYIMGQWAAEGRPAKGKEISKRWAQMVASEGQTTYWQGDAADAVGLALVTAAPGKKVLVLEREKGLISGLACPAIEVAEDAKGQALEISSIAGGAWDIRGLYRLIGQEDEIDVMALAQQEAWREKLVALRASEAYRVGSSYLSRPYRAAQFVQAAARQGLAGARECIRDDSFAEETAIEEIPDIGAAVKALENSVTMRLGRWVCKNKRRRKEKP